VDDRLATAQSKREESKSIMGLKLVERPLFLRERFSWFIADFRGGPMARRLRPAIYGLYAKVSFKRRIKPDSGRPSIDLRAIHAGEVDAKVRRVPSDTVVALR